MGTIADIMRDTRSLDYGSSGFKQPGARTGPGGGGSGHLGVRWILFALKPKEFLNPKP